MRETNKYFLWITAEVILLAIVGFLTNLLSARIEMNSSLVWGALIVALLLLVITSWFKAQKEEGLSLPRPTIPENITITLSARSVLQNLRSIVGLTINAMLFGWFTANASVFSTQQFPGLERTEFVALPITSRVGSLLFGKELLAYPFEIVGVFVLAWVSVIVWRRISSIAGLIFCLLSTSAFSMTHIMLWWRYQPFLLTTIGNVLSTLSLTVLGVLLYPFLERFTGLLVDFWKQVWGSA